MEFVFFMGGAIVTLIIVIVLRMLNISSEGTKHYRNGPAPIDREPSPPPAPPSKLRWANINPTPPPSGSPPVSQTKPYASVFKCDMYKSKF